MTMDANAGNEALLEELRRVIRELEKDVAQRTTRIRVNKRTQQIRFENESEESVEVVIEPKQ